MYRLRINILQPRIFYDEIMTDGNDLKQINRINEHIYQYTDCLTQKSPHRKYISRFRLNLYNLNDLDKLSYLHQMNIHQCPQNNSFLSIRLYNCSCLTICHRCLYSPVHMYISLNMLFRNNRFRNLRKEEIIQYPLVKIVVNIVSQNKQSIAKIYELKMIAFLIINFAVERVNSVQVLYTNIRSHSFIIRNMHAYLYVNHRTRYLYRFFYPRPAFSLAHMRTCILDQVSFVRNFHYRGLMHTR